MIGGALTSFFVITDRRRGNISEEKFLGIAELVPSKTRNLTPRNDTTDWQSLCKLKMQGDPLVDSVHIIANVNF